MQVKTVNISVLCFMLQQQTSENVFQSIENLQFAMTNRLAFFFQWLHTMTSSTNAQLQQLQLQPYTISFITLMHLSGHDNILYSVHYICSNFIFLHFHTHHTLVIICQQCFVTVRLMYTHVSYDHFSRTISVSKTLQWF